MTRRKPVLLIKAGDVHPLQKQHVEVNVEVECRPKTLNEGDGPGAGRVVAKPCGVDQVRGDGASAAGKTSATFAPETQTAAACNFPSAAVGSTCLCLLGGVQNRGLIGSINAKPISATTA